MCGLPQAFSRDLRLATIIYGYTRGQRIKSLSKVDVKFLKIVAFKGTTEIFKMW
jgi:hypothetical protein